MSEKNKNSTKPEVTPEVQKAFRGLYSTLMRATAKDGRPVIIIAKEGSQFFMRDKQSAEEGVPFVPNAATRYLPISDASGGVAGGWSAALSEDAANKYGVLGRLEVMEGKGSHPADVYMLYPDQSIEHIRRTAEDDGVDEYDEPINWREVNVPVGWLDAEQMRNLQLNIEEAEERLSSHN